MGPKSTTFDQELLPTRYSLLSRLQNWEDHESWRAFFDSYWRLIYSVARKSGLTESEAEEVVQETIISVAKGIQNFERDPARGSFKGWLCNVTRWRIADQFRKRTGLLRGEGGEEVRKYQPLEYALDLADQSVAVDWEQEWQANLLQAAMHRVKGRVKEEQYQLFDLCVVKQWPVSRIAQTLGVSAARIYLAKHRISRLLREEVAALEKDWNER